MANKRQRLAQKRFVAGGGIPSKPLKRKREPTEGEGGSDKKKKKEKSRSDKNQRGLNGQRGLKQMTQGTDDENRVHDAENLSSRPTKGKLWRLEQFGSDRKACHFCKGTDHVKSNCPSIDAKKICLLCRKWGHSIHHCPENVEGRTGGDVKAAKADGPACYNCGEKGHRLADCSKPLKDGGSAFATCFLCNQKGHLSKDCPSNDHGIYPKGGCCNVCGEVTHLAKDCPQKAAAKKAQKLSIPAATDSAKAAAGSGSKRIVFQSGDDLDDDFGGLQEDDGALCDEGLGEGEEVEKFGDDERPKALGEDGKSKKKGRDGKDRKSSHRKVSREKRK